MANMSYCRFENTLKDLRDCQRALFDGEIEDMSSYEKEALFGLLKLCKQIAEDFPVEEVKQELADLED